MRNLASIQRIAEIFPIEGADAIEVARVLGWYVVIKKGSFKVGGLCVYVEIDAILPDKPEFEFLRARKFRIKTIKLRGQISQGIIFSIEDVLKTTDYGKFKEGKDVTELLEIKKYDPEDEKPSVEPKYVPKKNYFVNKYCYAKWIINKYINNVLFPNRRGGNFPDFVRKTDETRVQNLQKHLTKLNGTLCYVTEKLEGSSTTFYVSGKRFGVASRNIKLGTISNDIRWTLAKEMDIEKKLLSLGLDVAIQGELIGPGVQKNIYELPKQEIRFFSVFFIKANRYATLVEFKDIMTKLDLIFNTVPILDEDFTLTDNIDDLVKMSEGVSKLNGKTKREGIVIRSVDLIQGEVFSCKAINPQYLLGQD